MPIANPNHHNRWLIVNQAVVSVVNASAIGALILVDTEHTPDFQGAAKSSNIVAEQIQQQIGAIDGWNHRR